MFLVELHLDVVLKVLLVVRFEFLLLKLVGKYQKKKKLGLMIYKWRRYLSF